MIRGLLMAGAALTALGWSNAAWAACTVTASPNTVSCTANTTTNDSGITAPVPPSTLGTINSNVNANHPSSSDYYQLFLTGGDVTASVGSGVTVDGFGLVIEGPRNRAISTGRVTMTNEGLILANAGVSSRFDGGAALTLIGNSAVSYSGAGSIRATVTNPATPSAGLVISALGDVTVNQGAGSTISSANGDGIRTGNNDTVSALTNITTNGTVISGGATAGSPQSFGAIQVNPFSSTAVTTVNVTNNGTLRANDTGIIVRFAGPQPGGDIFIVNNGSILSAAAPNTLGTGIFAQMTDGSAKNITVTLNSDVGAAGDLIQSRGVYAQTKNGSTGAVTINLANASIFSNGTGIAVNRASPAFDNGTGDITITGTGAGLIHGLTDAGIRTVAYGAGKTTISLSQSVTGATGISATSTGTGAIAISSSGAITGTTSAVSGTSAGGAFALTNSGVMTGAVNVTGSAVSTSLLTNSGTWNLGAGNSTFSGSVTNSGTLNLVDGTINTLTIGGNLTFSAGSIFRVDIGNGTNDRVNVTGTATLAGALAAFSSNGAFTAGRYTLLNATGGISGTFSPLTTSPATGASLRYDGNNVYLDINAAPGTTESFSTREALVFNAPVVTTNRVSVFSTQIIGRLLGGSPIYDQTFAAAFNSLTVQNALVAARAAITIAGGPGIIIGDAVRTSSSTTSVTSSASTYSLAGPGVATPTVVTTFGPATVQIGVLSTCSVSTLPSATRPTCTTGGTSYAVGDNETNFNTVITTTYTINENRTDTITDTLRETWEITGQVATVGMIHAEVQSGLFDLGSRLLNRLTGPLPVNAGWGEVYGWRVSQTGRRDARGFTAGVNVGLGANVTLALALDHGSLDLDVPGAKEDGDVRLTEGGAALRYENGPFSAALSATYGTGRADTLRTIIGASGAKYDVRVGGVALDLGYAFQANGWTLRPVAGLDYVSVSTDGFTESDTLGLVVGDQDPHRIRASAGLEIGRTLGKVQLAASARYLTVLSGDERTIPVAFALAPGRMLDMSAPNEPDSVLIGARASLALSPHASLWIAYDGRYGSGYTGHAGALGLSLTW